MPGCCPPPSCPPAPTITGGIKSCKISFTSGCGRNFSRFLCRDTLIAVRDQHDEFGRRLGRMLSIGINYSQMHDSSACIARDGEVLFAVAEERLSRVKHDPRFPSLSIQACLDFAAVKPEEVDFICQGWSAPRAPFLHDMKNYATGRQRADFYSILNSSRSFLSMWHQRGGEN